MHRDVTAIETVVNGTKYRSRTEARWAIFFQALDLTFQYEQESFRLSNGSIYLPDFYINDFSVYFEVKPDNEDIVTDECTKARCLAHDREDLKIWLAMGPPNQESPNILPLSQWQKSIPIESIIGTPENRYQILEDRRDDKVYWLHAKKTDGCFNHSYMVGGPGASTDHDRLPLLHRNALRAYEAASKANLT